MLVFLSFGTEPKRHDVSRQGPIPWVCETLGIAVTPRNLVIVALTIILVTALHLTLAQTTPGRKMRTTADNADLARVSGVRTGEIIFAMWFIGGALATAGGASFGLEELIHSRMGFDTPLIAFVAVILGGVGPVHSTILGGLIIGMVHRLVPLLYQRGTIPVKSQYAAAIAFVIMVAILLARLSGITGDNG